MEDKLISVIIPVYNTKDFLDECLESVVSQSYRNLEIILIDDFSSDGSGEKCDEWARKDERIIVIHNERNSGVSCSRNNGIRRASGDYITFVDSDDYILKDTYRSMLDMILRDNTDMVICGISELCGNKLIKGGRVHDDAIVNVKIAMEMCIPKAHIPPNYYNVNKLYDCRIIKKMDDILLFDEAYNFGEDMLWFVQALARSSHISTCSSDFYVYRIDRPGNTISTVLKSKANTRYTMSSITALEDARKIVEVYSKRAGLNIYQRMLTKRALGMKASLNAGDIDAYNFCNRHYIRDLNMWWAKNPSLITWIWSIKKALSVFAIRVQAVFNKQRKNSNE